MSGLGKRYVAVFESDGPDRGKCWADSMLYERPPSLTVTNNTAVAVLEVDLDLLLPVPTTNKQRTMHTEQMELH